MPAPIAIVISVDGLRASALGAYGGGWSETPALDRLASQAQVFDWMYCESLLAADFFPAVWGGLVSAVEGSRLVTDDPQVAVRGEATGFSEVLLLEGDRSDAAGDVVETGLAHLFAAAAEGLGTLSAGETRLLWVHARGFRGPWDAPAEMRERLLDEEDPPAAEFIDPPRAASIEDQDELLLIRTAYAAQAAVLDECVGGFLAAVDEEDVADRLLLALDGCAGFALGEHGAVGDQGAGLYGEALHVPCLIRTPSTPPPPRDAELRRPTDLSRRVAAWLRGETPFDEGGPPYLVATAANGEATVRTDEWMLRRPAAESAAAELYVKPDDRWEANDVARRCPEIVDELLALLARLEERSGPESG